MAAKTLPDQKYLRECFLYDRGSGVVCWRSRPLHHFADTARRRAEWTHSTWNSRCAGTEITCQNAGGYIIFGLGADVLFYLHRAIWKLETGLDPFLIDHWNGVRNDNRWINLRDADDTRNNWNRRRAGPRLKGVTFDPRCGSYLAKIKVFRQSIYLGSFGTEEAAHAAYCAAARQHFGEFWNPG